MKLTADNLRGFNLKHDFIVDVGVWRGTPWLYDAYPEDDFILIDPDLSKVTRWPRYTAEALEIAAGAERGSGRLEGQNASKHVVEGSGPIPVMPLSDLIARNGRFGLKVDAEGADADVILGLGHRRADVSWLIVEMPLVPNLHPRGGAGPLIKALEGHFRLQQAFEPDWPSGTYRNQLYRPVD